MTYQGEHFSEAPASGPDRARSDVASQEASQVAGTVKEQGQAVSGAAQEGGQRVVTEAKEQVGQLTQQAQGHLQDLLGRSQEEFSGRASEQTDKAAANLRQVAQELQALAEGRTQEASRMVGYVRQAADRVEQYAGRLDRDGFSAVANDLGGFARRRPGVFLLSAVAAGFTAGRLARGAQAVSGANQDSPQIPQTSGYHSASSALPTPPAGPSSGYPVPVAAEVSAGPVTAAGPRGAAEPLEDVLPLSYLSDDPDEPGGPGVR